MKRKNFALRTMPFVAFAAVSVYIGCGGEKLPDVEDTADEFKIDTTTSAVIEMGNVKFCIPSPVQTAFLIKDIGATYNKDILNSPDNLNIYSTNFKKALNMGIYGADLGYATIYEQTQEAIGYLNTVRNLADDLGISGAFSESTMKRLMTNISNRDSLLNMVSVCYRDANAFLQNNDRQDACALILAGGWIESVYFSTKIGETLNNQQLINRVGEQKNTLNNLIKLIEPHYNDSPDFTEFLDRLYGLYDLFDEITLTYTFAAPSIDPKKKFSTINSVSNVNITEAQFASISALVDEIRENITD